MTLPRVVAVGMVRDEFDIIETTLTHMAAQGLHGLIVADNGSVDGTRDLLDYLATHVLGCHTTILDDPEIAYYQSKKMTALAHLAVEQGAEWIIPFDADEIWYSGWGTIPEVLADVPTDSLIVQADLFDHVATAVDPDDLNPCRRLGWRRLTPLPFPKVAVRAIDGLVIHPGNHGATFGARAPNPQPHVLVVRHFPYRSEAQMLVKGRNAAQAYAAAADLPEHTGAHWRGFGQMLDAGGDAALLDHYRTWFYSEDPEHDTGLVFDPAPIRWRP